MALANLIVEGLIELPEDERARALSQWYTERQLAERVCAWAVQGLEPPRALRLLEPTAGEGALVRPFFSGVVEQRTGVRVERALAIDIDPRNVKILKALQRLKKFSGLKVQQAEFVTWSCEQVAVNSQKLFDLCVMNPPYENGMDVACLRGACMLAERVVAILRSDVLFSRARRQFWDKHRVVRRVNLSERPSYLEPWVEPGEEATGMTDFVVLQVEQRPARRHTGQVDMVAEEWW